MVDSSRAIPVELAQSHFFNFFNAGFVTLRILCKQLSPDVLHAVPILFQLQQRGDHLRLEIGVVVVRIKTFCEALGTFFTVEELWYAPHYFQPLFSGVGGGFRQRFRKRHGKFVHGERGVICPLQIQQPVVLICRGRLRQIYEEFLIWLLVEHAVAHRERNVPSVVLIADFRSDEFNLTQYLIGGALAYQCRHIIHVLLLIVAPKYDAPAFARLAETFSEQSCYLAILTHAVPSFSSLQRIE